MGEEAFGVSKFWMSLHTLNPFNLTATKFGVITNLEKSERVDCHDLGGFGIIAHPLSKVCALTSALPVMITLCHATTLCCERRDDRHDKRIAKRLCSVYYTAEINLPSCCDT